VQRSVGAGRFGSSAPITDATSTNDSNPPATAIGQNHQWPEARLATQTTPQMINPLTTVPTAAGP